MTLTTTLVLQAIAGGHKYGFDIVDVTGFPTGTVYPALRRLERDGLVESRWESDEDAAQGQRPARRYYQITKAGKAAVLTATRRYPLLARLVQEKRT